MLHVPDSDFMISIQRIKRLCTMDFKCRHELILIKFETQKFHFEYLHQTKRIGCKKLIIIHCEQIEERHKYADYFFSSRTGRNKCIQYRLLTF